VTANWWTIYRICNFLILQTCTLTQNEFKKGYNPTTNVVWDDKGDLIAGSHSILATWRNHFSQLLNIHEVNDVRQTELHTAEPLVPERMRWLLKSCKDTQITSTDRIPAEYRRVCFRIHKLPITPT
jgi:hypothetical protein